MSPRPVPLWRTLLNLAVLAGLCWFAYQKFWVEKWGAGDTTEAPPRDQGEQIAARVVAVFGKDPCFYDLQGPPAWRPNDNYYKLEVLVEIGCDDKASALCKSISDLVEREFRLPCSVWAYLKDRTREVGRYVR